MRVFCKDAKERESEEALRKENQALRKEVRDLARLHDAGWRLRQAESLREGLAELLSATIDLLGADMGDVQLLDENGRLYVAAQLGFERDFDVVECFREVSVKDETEFAERLRSGEPVTVEDIELETAFAPYRSAAAAADYRALVSAPLTGRHGTLIGIVSAYFRSPHRSAETDMRRLELYQRRAADFIERFRSDEALRESNANLAAEKKASAKFYEAGLKVLQAKSLSEALDILISGSMDLLGADMGIIQLLDDDGKLLRLAAQRGFTEDILGSFFELSSAGDTSRGRALRTGRPVVIEDVESDEAYAPFRSTARKAGYRAIIAAPLIGRHEIPQGMMVLHYRSPYQPSETDLEHLELYRRRGGDFIERFKAEETLRQSEERLRLAVNSSRMGMWDWDVTTGKYYWNDENYRLFGYDRGNIELNRAAWAARVHPEDLEAADAAATSAQRDRKDYFNEYRIIRPDGSVRWVRAHGRFLYQNEKPVRMIGLMEDITEARQQIETQRVLVAELQHRTRNLMAVVQSIAIQTLHTVSSLVEFENNFNSRLEALSRVQSLLSRTDSESITVGELVVMELEALALTTAGDRITFGGPEAPLRKSAVEMLSLAFHELLTNAIKYGALASETGRLWVTWWIEDAPSGQSLVLEWIERGISLSPRTADPKPSGGYGRMLIEEALPYSIAATTSYELSTEGLRCLISLPLPIKGTGEVAA